jgi:hypothetical protein
VTIFTLEPYKKITVRSYMRYENPETFARALTIGVPRGFGGRVGNLFWANGILFRHFPYAPTDSVSKQHLRGILPIDHIEYASMSEFQNEIRVDDFTVSITNVSAHTTFNALTKWITKKLEKRR